MSAKHTPGPWIIRYNSPSVEAKGKREGLESLTVEKVGNGLRSIIADIDNWKLCDEHGDILSNARLIAAAPDLLEAAKWVVKKLAPEDEKAAMLMAAISKVEDRQ